MPSGSCFVPASIAALHASLSSEPLSLRQVVISYALGVNALQSLSTSGVHAKRCSGVPCEKERAGEARGQQRQRHAQLRQRQRPSQRPFVAFYAHQRTHGRYRYTPAGDRACRETSEFVAFDPAAILPDGGAVHRADMRGCSVSRLRINLGCIQTTKSSHVCPSVGNNADANVSY